MTPLFGVPPARGTMPTAIPRKAPQMYQHEAISTTAAFINQMIEFLNVFHLFCNAFLLTVFALYFFYLFFIIGCRAAQLIEINQRHSTTNISPCCWFFFFFLFWFGLFCLCKILFCAFFSLYFFHFYINATTGSILLSTS